MPGRAVRGEEGRALRVVERRRQRHELIGRHNDLVGIAAEPRLHDHLVAYIDAICTRDLDHLAGRFHPRRERQRRLELILPRRHQDVGKIQSRRMDRDAHLTRCQRGTWDIFQLQGFRRPEFAADNGARHSIDPYLQ